MNTDALGNLVTGDDPAADRPLSSGRPVNGGARGVTEGEFW